MAVPLFDAVRDELSAGTARQTTIYLSEEFVMTEIRKFIRPLPVVSCAVLAALAFFLKFCVPGYSFSALVCCGIIAVIVFYEVTRLLLPRYPRVLKPLRKVFTVCLIIGLLIFSITEGCIIGASFGNPEKQCDYFVVLGAKVRDDGPSVSLWDRIYGAESYLKSHPDAIAVVSGGQGADEPMSEGQAMYDELVKLGIDPERIWIEDKATSTRENITFALDLIEERTGTRPDTLGVVSSEYHLLRAGLLTRECGVDFVGIPAKTSRASQLVNHMMREAAAIWEYLVLGG